MKYSNTVEYNISTKLDSSGLQKLKTELQQVELKLQKMGNQKLLNPDDFSNARTQIRGLSDALSKAFDPTLGITNLSKLNEELKSSGVTTEGLRSAFSQLGTDGQIAFNNVIGELGKLDTGILRTNSQIDKLFTTFSNTFRWGLVSSFFSQFMNAIHSSVDYVKELDDSLTQIMLVTDYNRDSMNEFAKSANEAAKAVSMTTTGMTNASLIFAQQGYDLGQSQELATLSAKLANASQQDTATTSDQITAYMNAYGLQNSMEELTQQMDNWALIANVSAADVGELAQASQRAASMANAVGVSGEQLASQIATIESVTREAPEQIGNGLKTLYARFSDIAAGGEDEDGFTLGKVTSQLQAIGVQIFDQMGQIRDVGDIMEDLMVIWDDLDQTSKVAASQALAGKYQVNRFMALMDNSDMYEEYKGATGANAAGTLDMMNEEYAQSIEGRSAKLQASLEGLFSTIFNTDDIYPWMDAAQEAIDLLQQFFDALGGGKTVLLGISSLLMQIFSKNIAQEINNATINNAVQEQRKANLENKQAALSNMGMANPELDNGMSNYIIDFAKQINSLDLNKEQAEQANNILMELTQNANAAGQASDELTTKISGIGTALVSTLGEDSKILAPILEDGIINDTLLRDFLDNASDDQLKELFEGSRQAIAQTKNELKEFSQALQTFQQETKENDQSADELKNSIERLRDAFSYIKNTIDTSTYNQYDEELRNIIETLENSDDASDDVSVLTNRIAKLYEELDKIKGINVEKIQQISSDLERSNFKQINTQGAFEGTKQVGNAFLNSANKTGDIKSIIDTVNAVQQLTFAWQTFQNLGSIWKNNKLSDGEKFLQTFMSLTSAILMMQPAIEVLSKKFGVLNLQQAANVLTSAKLTIAKHAETIAFGASSVAAGDLAAKQWLLVAAEEAATIATTALKTALTLLASPAGIIGIMGIATAIGFVQAQAEEAKQQALDNFEDAKSALQEIEALKEKTSAFGEKYAAFKETGEGGDELAQQARDIAQALKDAGAEEEANALHLAILNAEAKGTAESFKELAQEIEKAQIEAEKQTNQEIIDSSKKVLENQDASAKDVLMHQKMIKDTQEELNNLDPLDAGYEKEKERLEHLIDTLKNAKLAQEDLINAANEYQQAQGKLAGITTAENQGLNLYAGGQQGQRMNPDSAIWFENANLDYNSIERIYSNMVEGFSDLSNLEKAQFILETIGDEAGKAAAQLELLMQSFNNLDANQIDHLQNQMAQGGLTFSQQQLLTSSLDPDATAAEFSQTIQDVLQNMDENNTTFEVALKATLKNPEEFQETIRQQVQSYEPKDDEIEQENYNSMVNHFYENKDKMGEEDSGFENYSEDLFDNAEALSEVIEDTLRYSNAIEEISDNFDDWIDVLNKGEKTSEDYVNAVDGLKDTFSDFLGIPEELSEEFVTTQENLNDLQAAAEGDVDAFDRLQTAAAIDLAEQLGVDSDTATTAVSNIQSALNELGYSEVDIGEIITFSDDALNTINTQLDNLCLDADQAAAYLESAFGIKVSPGQFEYVQNDIKNTEQMAANSGSQMANDMTVTPEITTASAEQVATDEKNYTDVDPNITYEPWTATLPVTGGGLGAITTASTPTPVPISGEVPVITYNAKSKTAKETKTDTAMATGVKAEQGGSGVPKNSHVNLKSGSSGTRTGGKAPSSSAPRPSSSGGGGGGGKKSCFVAGTLVSIWGGFKPIEQIKKGNIVLSYNKQLGINEYSEVIQTMIHDTTEPIYTLYIKDEQLRVTGIHRFLVTDKITCGIPQWVHAADLHVGQWVLFADGTWHVIYKIEVNIEHQTVYNFEVSGNHNYYVGRNQILAHNKGGGKKGKKGGGGGGKAKTAEKKEEEKYQKKYYEEVDHQLDKVDKTLDNVEKTTEKLVGTKARTKQNEQIKLLQREILLQEKKLKILRDQEKTDVSKAISEADKKLEDLLKKEGLDIKIFDIAFDKDGFIRNTDEIGQAIIDAENELIKERNNLINSDGTISDTNEEKLKEIDKQIEKYKELGDELTKNMDRYNDIVNEELEIENTIEEIKDQIQDINIDIYKASQEALDDLKDLREEWAKFNAGIYDADAGESFLYLDNPIRQLKEIENEITSIYTISGQEARNYYNEIIKQQEKLRDSATAKEDIKAYQQAIDYFTKIRDSIEEDANLNNGLMQLALNDVIELQKIWDEWDETSRDNPIFGDNKSALKEALENAQKRLMEYAQDYEELIEDLKEATLDIADHTSEQWDRQLDRFDRVLDQLDRYSDTYSLIYGDEAYDMQEAVLNQQAQTLKSQLDTAKQAYDDAYKYYLEAYEKFIDKETGLAKEGYEDYMYELEQAVADAEENMRDIAADAAEKFAEAFEAAVKASTQYILRNTIGENDFDHLDRNWEWDKEYIDKYRDNVEKAYEMDKLRNKYLDILNDAQGASLQTQNKIRTQMQEQLDLLDGQATVSEYDVKLANAKLEILQKQIALEDAQRNKNRMQLRRDTQGNYRYVYRADQDNVKQAQQELTDSEYDAYEMSKQQQMNNYDDMINAYKNYLSQREEILTNNNLSEAQKIQQIQELWDRFQKYVNAAQEDFSNATSGTVDILQWLVVNGTDYTTTAATNMLNTLLDEEGNVIEQSGIIWMDMANNIANNVIPNIENAVIIADENIERKLHETHDNLIGEDGSGGIFGEVAAGANNFGDQCEVAAQQTAILAEQSYNLADALTADSSAFTEALADLQDYQHQLEVVAESSSNTAAALRDTQAALDKTTAEKLNYKTQIDKLLSGEDIIVDHKIVNAAEYKKKQEEEKKKQQQKSGSGGGGRNALADARAIWYQGAWGHGGDWYTPYSRQYGTAAANKVLWYFNHGYGYNFEFDTGGYTGEWNQGEGVSNHKNGKLAFLHQKELVLNQTDTANILAAVNTMREISNSMQGSLSGINQTANINNISSTYNPVTEQRVEIQASFPNATDAEDIRQALINLSDKAYQYSYRTR